ncbi:hypothetical protein D0859_05277 [Hortaea werneckii]|uniref:C2 domain-containing protein n=1 Tax=Hortaea werneckii TaxID=91943 RepID=A0A3M7IZ08_HORWE|nr:hypothetical protein D0859_05277 [Hortaea werneckii]
MASRQANMGPNPHTAGIFADMSVDGPEIGTLVLICDRARNLPNRRTMGKQSAYCAARLGKEAKKTETDKRADIDARDQELRYTVHDSPDYYALKISIFSEDKKTDLIGEALINLKDVIVPGGGKNDMWQGLHCKGKYAGEIRIELTYYDTRPKPDGNAAAEGETVAPRHGKVKRRPLPTNPHNAHVTPDTIPEPSAPGRARHGPRDFSAPPRVKTVPDGAFQHQQLHSLYGHQPLPHAAEASQHFDDPQAWMEPPMQEDLYRQPDFLPQLPPSNRQRSTAHLRAASQQAQPVAARPAPPHLQGGLPHAHSAPIVPQATAGAGFYDDGGQLWTDYPEAIPDVEYQHQRLRQRRMDVPPGWQEEYGDPYAAQQMPPDVEPDGPPPPPPMHSNSAPTVPHFTPSPVGTPPSANHRSIPSTSPLQMVERQYGSPQHTPPTRGRHPPRGRSVDDYGPSPDGSLYGGTPPSLVPGQSPPSAYGHGRAPRGMPHRHSVADPYGSTPPRSAHPLSQEVPRARSPRPPPMPQSYEPPPNPQARYNDPAQMARGPSPQPAMSASRSTYNLQYPIRSFASSDKSPLSTSQSDPRLAGQTPPSRKSLNSQPPPLTDHNFSPKSAGGGGGTPFSPDSFDIHNPNARPSQFGASPKSPWQVAPDSTVDGQSSEHPPSNGPIVGWHGQEIDPSDHLPVNSWAPEPEKKTPSKTYGAGRDRDFGPRSAGGTPNSGTGSPATAAVGNGRLGGGKDTVINFRMKPANNDGDVSPSSASSPSGGAGGGGGTGIRNRLQKKMGLGTPNRGSAPHVMPLQEHENFNNVPNPYAPPPSSTAGSQYHQQQRFSPEFMTGSPTYGGGGGGAPGVPPKLPMDYSQDLLSREISSIDIGGSSGGRYPGGSAGGFGGGGGRYPMLPPSSSPSNGGGGGGGVPAPTAYVPVRSQRDRATYY